MSLLKEGKGKNNCGCCVKNWMADVRLGSRETREVLVLGCGEGGRDVRERGLEGLTRLRWVPNPWMRSLDLIFAAVRELRVWVWVCEWVSVCVFVYDCEFRGETECMSQCVWAWGACVDLWADVSVCVMCVCVCVWVFLLLQILNRPVAWRKGLPCTLQIKAADRETCWAGSGVRRDTKAQTC